jgi:hypothetical protein
MSALPPKADMAQHARNVRFVPKTGKLDVRFLITTNVLPAIRDASGTIATRYILLQMTESFLGREDLDLKDFVS